MPANLPTQIEFRKQRWRQLMAGTGTVKDVFTIEYQPDNLPKPWPRPDTTAQRLEWAWDRYQRHLRRMTWLEDDSLPYLDCLSGTEIFAEAFGCTVHYPEDNMPFALPRVQNAEEAERVPMPSLDCPALQRHFDFADELVRRAGPGALVRLVDVQSPMDIVALIWDKNDFYLAMLETPDAVHALADKVRQLLTAFLDEWFRRYGRNFIAHFPDYYMEGGLTLSEDEVGVVSEAMFTDFFLPELTELSTHFGGLGMHCCANSRHQWANFKKIPGLRLLNIVQPPAIVQEAMTYFGPDVVHHHQWMGNEPVWERPQQTLANLRAVITASAKDRDEALKLAEQLAVATGR